MHDTEPLLGHQ